MFLEDILGCVLKFYQATYFITFNRDKHLKKSFLNLFLKSFTIFALHSTNRAAFMTDDCSMMRKVVHIIIYKCVAFFAVVLKLLQRISIQKEYCSF